MTAPTEPTPTAPAGPAQPAPGAPTLTPTLRPTPGAQPTPVDANTPVDVSSLPANVQNLISALRGEAAKSRTEAKATADTARKEMAAQVAKALGLAGDEPPDPAELARQLEQDRDRAWTYAVELELYRTVGPDAAVRLIDSLSFLNSLDELSELHPNSPEFKEQLKTKAQEAAAKLAAPPAGQAPATGPRPDPSQGTRGTPPVSRPTSITQALNAHYAAKAAGRR